MSPALSGLGQYRARFAGFMFGFFNCLPVVLLAERDPGQTAPNLWKESDSRLFYTTHGTSCFAPFSLLQPPAAGGGFPSADGQGLTELHPDFMRTRSNRSRCGDVPTNLSCGEGATCLGQGMS